MGATEVKEIKRMRLYIGSTLLGQMTTGTIRELSNDEQGHGNDGSNYWSDGNNTCEIDFDAVRPAVGYSVQGSGTTASLTSLVRKHQTFTITGVVGEEAVAYSGRMMSAEHKGESKTGMLTGAFKFQGGEANVVG